MSSRSDQSTDESQGEQGAYDRYEEPEYEGEESGRFSYVRSWGSGGAWGMWPGSSTDEDVDELEDTEPTEAHPDEQRRSGSGISRLPGGSRTTALIVGGAVLLAIAWLRNRRR